MAIPERRILIVPVLLPTIALFAFVILALALAVNAWVTHTEVDADRG